MTETVEEFKMPWDKDTLIIQGFLISGPSKSASNVLFAIDPSTGKFEEPIVDMIECASNWQRCQVNVMWHIMDRQVPIEEISELVMLNLLGDQESGELLASMVHHYSELTGYLWTDEHLKVGNHDLMEILRGNLGKWLYLKIKFHR